MHSASLLILNNINKRNLVEKLKQRYLLKTRPQPIYPSNKVTQEAGFTLIEVLVVVIMVGVLAAIVAPSWLAFVNTQQVNKANDVILGAVQEAQRGAKKQNVFTALVLELITTYHKLLFILILLLLLPLVMIGGKL